MRRVIENTHSRRDRTCPHDLPSGYMLAQTRGLGTSIPRRSSAGSQQPPCPVVRFAESLSGDHRRVPRGRGSHCYLFVLNLSHLCRLCNSLATTKRLKHAHGGLERGIGNRGRPCGVGMSEESEVRCRSPGAYTRPLFSST